MPHFVGVELGNQLTEKHNGLRKALRYNPESNGIVGRGVGKIKEWMRANSNNREWDTQIEKLIFYLNLISEQRKQNKQIENENRVRQEIQFR